MAVPIDLIVRTTYDGTRGSSRVLGVLKSEDDL
jgi:hypothetical protein